ncbi:MAG: hypothetical protein IJR49_01825 [Treponema sp.]|nr:hypothetical protein [Treponema sp.]
MLRPPVKTAAFLGQLSFGNSPIRTEVPPVLATALPVSRKKTVPAGHC